MWRLHKIALDAEHEFPGARVKVLRLQPREVFLQHLIGQSREKRFQLEERRLLLDDAVNSYVAEFEARDHRPNSEIGKWLLRGSSVASSEQNGRLICYFRRSVGPRCV